MCRLYTCRGDGYVTQTAEGLGSVTDCRQFKKPKTKQLRSRALKPPSAHCTNIWQTTCHHNNPPWSYKLKGGSTFISDSVHLHLKAALHECLMWVNYSSYATRQTGRCWTDQASRLSIIKWGFTIKDTWLTRRC